MNLSNWDGSDNLVALVCYVPDPLGSILNQLTRNLPSDRSSQAHITLLPPRPLRVALNKASEHVRAVLRNFPAFDIELANVELFPETNVLYLEIGKGAELLYQLHDALNSGDLFYDEPFEFRPHLTLSAPIPEPHLRIYRQLAEARWNSLRCSKHLVADEAVFLCTDQKADGNSWRRLWAEQLTVSHFSPA